MLFRLREQAAAEQRAREAEEAAQEQGTAMEEKLTRAEEEVSYQKGLNANLLRISRERANADRSLRPKKEHTGYAVVRSMEKEYRYKISRQSWGKVMLWETVIQSPYSMEFTEEQARKQIRRELLRDKNGGDWLIGKVGIRVSCDLEFEDNACVCVVLASDGYPVKYEKGFKITGFEKFDGKEDYYCYHAGTKFDDDGNIVTNGGRVLGITATGATLKEARAKAYEATEWVQFDNKYMRHDIGKAIDEA